MKNYHDKPEELGRSCWGKGTAIWYKYKGSITVANISESGYELSLYGHKLSYLAMAEIEGMVIRNVRKAHEKIPKWNYETIPIIAKIETNPNYFFYGVQYWTPEMIDKKENENTDNSISHYVALLQQMKHGEGESKIEITDWHNHFGDRFVVNTDEQSDYFKTFVEAFTHFQNLQ